MNKLEEAEKLAKMDEDQKKDYELEQWKQRAEKAEKQNSIDKLRNETIKQASEKGISLELVDVSNDEIKGRVYADPNKFMTGEGISYLFFEYFGTGSNAEMEHIGTTKHFIESGYTEWFIPVNKVTKALNYPTITIYDQQFYIAHGSKANHFMGDAEFQARKENKEIVGNKLKEMIERCCE